MDSNPGSSETREFEEQSEQNALQEKQELAAAEREMSESLDVVSCVVEELVERVVDLVHLAPPEAPAQQSANLLLRHCSAAKAAHLMRLLPPDVTKALAERVDAAVLKCFGLVNNLSAAEVANKGSLAHRPSNL